METDLANLVLGFRSWSVIMRVFCCTMNETKRGKKWYVMNFLMKAMRWMSGRYGTDDFSRFLMIAGLAASVLTMVFRIPLLSIMGLFFVTYAVMRGLSRDHSRRLKENQWFQKKKYKVTQTYYRWKNKLQQRKVYRYYKCPSCKQKLRVPKGKKKIKITCPNCSTQFVKQT